MRVFNFTFTLLMLLTAQAFAHNSHNRVNSCQLSESLKREIASYSGTVERIIRATTRGSFRNVTYNELAKFIDTFGSRKTATKNLENAIDYMLNISYVNQLENVHGEEVSVPNWIRGKESAYILRPIVRNLPILGAGLSIGTPMNGLTAEALVVKSFDDLKSKANKVPGKIVVFNQEYVSYETIEYLFFGAREAAKFGAVAALIRSITPFSLRTLHTGILEYNDTVKKIPCAAITVEDAHLLQRIQDRGERIDIELRMGAYQLPDAISRNTIVEVCGAREPNKIVLLSGHLDSWDVGEGAMDNGAGAFVSWAALVLLKRLNLRPRRTLRGALWTGEEFGLIGALSYKRSPTHQADLLNFVMESDEGTFEPRGVRYTAGKVGECVLKEILKLFGSIHTTQAVNESGGVGSDISIWTSEGFPGVSLYTPNDTYMWYHHSAADTLDVESPRVLDKITGFWASLAYIIADLSIDFPKN